MLIKNPCASDPVPMVCTRLEGPESEFKCVPVEPAVGETTLNGAVLKQSGDLEPATHSINRPIILFMPAFVILIRLVI